MSSFWCYDEFVVVAAVAAADVVMMLLQKKLKMVVNILFVSTKRC